MTEVQPPEGWRLLEPGELTDLGDKVLSSVGTWNEIYILNVGHSAAALGSVIRRNGK